MGSDTLVKGILICCVYVIICYIESHFITKEPIKLKAVVQSTLIVYISYVAGIFVFDQLEPMKKLTKAPAVFTAEPDF